MLMFTVVCGCSGGPSDGEDAGRDAGAIAIDAGGDAGKIDAGRFDAGGVDAGSVPDAGVDGGPRSDAGPIGAGECSEGPCPPECFRAYTCVRVCGGPETICGCCPCAAGSIDSITCPPES